MDSIPPDVAKKLLNRDFADLVKRVQAGGNVRIFVGDCLCGEMSLTTPANCSRGSEHGRRGRKNCQHPVNLRAPSAKSRYASRDVTDYTSHTKSPRGAARARD